MPLLLKQAAPAHRVTYVGLAAMLALAGCDRMPEMISGRAPADAKPVVAVGPRDNAPPAGVAAVHLDRPASPTTEDSSLLSPAVHSPAGSDAVPAEAASAAFVPVQYTEAAGDANRVDASVRPSLPPPQNYANEPPGNASRAERPTDGIIVIENAHLKFVDDIEIAARTDGLITEFNVEEGDWVTASSKLVQLDPRLAQAEVDVAAREHEAAVEKSKDDSEIKYAVAARDVASADLETSKELLAKRAETQSDHRKKQLEAYRAALAIPVAELKHNQDVAAAKVTASKKNMADVQLERLTIPADFDGMVAEKHKDVYDWVRAGDVVLRLVSMKKLRVIGLLPTDLLEAPPHMLLNAPAKVEVELYPGVTETVEGRIGFVSPVMQSSGGYKVWLEIDNRQVDGQWLFREGMAARISINARK